MMTVGVAGQNTIGVGLVLEGKYRVLEQLGEGSMGLVYSAIHETIQRKLAIKTLRPEIARDSDVVERFQQEARAAGSLGHPNIVQIFDAGCTPEGAHYIVMEHLEGKSLEAELADNPLQSPERAALIILQVLSGLAAAHRRNIVHRDLKPANIFIAQNDDQEVVKILDFGISKILESKDSSQKRTNATTAGSIVGTPLYMSPEQARGGTVDLATDIWAVGAVLYEMLCGVPPFNFDHPVRVLNAILDGRFPPPSAHRPGIPKPLEDVIMKALQPMPEARYKKASDMAQALKEAMRGAATPYSSNAIAEGTGRTFLAPSPGNSDEESKLIAALSNVSEDLLTGGDDHEAPIPKSKGTVAGPVKVKGRPGAKPSANPLIPDRSKEAKRGDDDAFTAPETQAPDVRLELDRAPLQGPRFDRRPLAQPRADRRPGTTIHSIERERRQRVRLRTLANLVFLVLFFGAAGGYLYRYHRLGYWGLKPPKPTTADLVFDLSPSDAEILIDEDLVTQRPLKVTIGQGKTLTFRAPNRLAVRRYVVANHNGSTHVRLRLPLAMGALEPSGHFDLPTAEMPAAPIEDLEALDIANAKLSLYERCSKAVSQPLMDSRSTFQKSGGKGVVAIPADTIAECRSVFAEAAERQPKMPRLENAANEYLESLKTIGPTTRDYDEYLDRKAYTLDGNQAGQRFASILEKEFARVDDFHRVFHAQLLAERMQLDTLELKSVKSREGEGLHYHMRNVAIASQTLAIALQNKHAKKLHEEKRTALRVALNAARDFALHNPQQFDQAREATGFMNSIPAVLQAEPTQGISWHNQSVKLFNGIVLP
jgi:serine/threonine protein kinase